MNVEVDCRVLEYSYYLLTYLLHEAESALRS